MALCPPGISSCPRRGVLTYEHPRRRVLSYEQGGGSRKTVGLESLGTKGSSFISAWVLWCAVVGNSALKSPSAAADAATAVLRMAAAAEAAAAAAAATTETGSAVPVAAAASEVAVAAIAIFFDL